MIVCPLFSGSSGNSTYVEHGASRILVDCGGSGKQIENALKAIDVDPRRLTAIVVTHSHDDHIRGVGVLSRRYDLPVYASVGTWDYLIKRNKIGSVATKNIRVFQSGKTNETLDLGDVAATYFPTPHDAYDSGHSSTSISAALVTTVVGLIVAIPGIVAFGMMNARGKAITSDMEGFADELMGRIACEYQGKGD